MSTSTITNSHQSNTLTSDETQPDRTEIIQSSPLNSPMSPCEGHDRITTQDKNNSTDRTSPLPSQDDSLTQSKSSPSNWNLSLRSVYNHTRILTLNQNLSVLISYIICVLYTEFWLFMLHLVTTKNPMLQISSPQPEGASVNPSPYAQPSRFLPNSSRLEEPSPIIYLKDYRFLIHLAIMIIATLLKYVSSKFVLDRMINSTPLSISKQENKQSSKVDQRGQTNHETRRQEEVSKSPNQPTVSSEESSSGATTPTVAPSALDEQFSSQLRSPYGPSPSSSTPESDYSSSLMMLLAEQQSNKKGPLHASMDPLMLNEEDHGKLRPNEEKDDTTRKSSLFSSKKDLNDWLLLNSEQIKSNDFVTKCINWIFLYSDTIFIMASLSNFTLRFILCEGKIPFSYLVITPFLALVSSSRNYWHIMYIFMGLLGYILFLVLGFRNMVLKLVQLLLNNDNGSIAHVVEHCIGTSVTNISQYFGMFHNINTTQAALGLIELTPIYGFFLWKIYHSFLVKMDSYRAQRETKRQQMLLEMLMNNIPSVLWSIDKNLRFSFVRGRGLAQFGIISNPDALIGKSLEEAFSGIDPSLVVDPSLLPTAIQHHKLALQGETVSYPMETSSSILHCTISPWKSEKGEVIGAVGIANDVTGLVKAENALRTSEEHYRSLVNNIQDLIVKTDEKGVILFTNSRQLRFLDKSPCLFAGRNVTQFFETSQKLKEEAERQFNLMLQDKKPQHWEWSIPDRSDKDQKTNLFFTAQFNPILKDGEVIAVTLICADVTEKRRVQESIMVAEKARIANKSKSDFLRVLSHELRNPLNSVLGALQLLSSTSNLSSLQSEYIEDANESAKLLLAIIQDVLDMSKIEAGKLTLSLEPFSILDTVETTADMYYTNALEKNLEVVTYIDPNIPVELIGDKTRLGQILSNLCTNSIKFTHHGYVYLYAKLVSETDSHATIMLGCEDTGIGIPEEGLAQIFKPFSQLNSSSNATTKGWGLGLAITDRLVKLMKGSISVRSPANKYGGSVFSFTVEFSKSLNPPTLIAEPIEEKELTVEDTKKSIVCHSIAENVHYSKFGNVIVMLTSEVLTNTVLGYLKVLHVPNCEVVYSEQQLKEAIDRHLNRYDSEPSPVEESMLRLCIMIESSFESLLPENILDRIASEDNNSLKLITLFTASHEPDSNTSELPKSKMNASMRKPMKFSRLMAALSERKNSMSNLMWDTKLNPHLLLHTENGSALHEGTIKENHKDMEPLQILIVEDSALNRKIVTRLLQKLGPVEIDEAVNGEMAIQCVKQKKGVYDCIFMDLQMPIMDGKQATTAIRSLADEEKRRTPIVALTANAWTNERENCLKIGMNDVLTKPITLDGLISAIRRITTKMSKDRTESN